jgi:hypothetical protein
VATDDDLAQVTEVETDANGQTVMEQIDERYELRVDQATGMIYTEAVPVYAPKLRELTTQELADLKEQRDRNLDTIEQIAV